LSIQSLSIIASPILDTARDNQFLQTLCGAEDCAIGKNIISNPKLIASEVYGCHQIRNAFDDIDFGNDGGGGIYGSTPTDMMHAFEEGIVPYILHVLFDPMSPKLLSEIDLYMDSILSKESLRSSERECFPHINFTRGFTRLTLLTASEKIGALMALVIFIRTPRGCTIMSPRFQSKASKKNYGQYWKYFG